MLTITITEEEFTQLKQLQIESRKDDWDMVFSTNGYEMWPFATWGLTPDKKREELRKQFPVLDTIQEEYRKMRGVGGGRIFVSRKGAFFRPNSETVQFVWFEFSQKS